MFIPDVLQEEAGRIRELDVDLQEVPFDRDAWLRQIDPNGVDGVAIGDIFDGLPQNVIKRKDIFDRAPADPASLAPCTPADTARWIRFFILVMIWGYGNADRRGPWRVNRMLQTPDLARIACQAGEECFYGLFLTAYVTLHSINWVGPAYASKLLYFYCHNYNASLKPLILDSVVVSTMRTFNWPIGCVDSMANGHAPKGRNPHAYGQYLTMMHNWAHTLRCRPDQIEFFLWVRGMETI